MNLLRRSILAASLLAALLSPLAALAQAPPAVPALPDTERRTSYSLTGSNCSCNVNFALYGDSTDYQDWIEVWLNGVQVAYNDPTYGWSIVSPTGPLATIPRPITDAILYFNNDQTGTVQIVGADRPRRLSQFAENRGVAARDLNQAITGLVAIDRELWDKTSDLTGRGLFSQPGNTMGPLPLPSACINGFLGFGSNGLTPTCLTAGPGSGNVQGPVSSTVGHFALWNNATGSLLSDAGPGITYTNSGILELYNPSGSAELEVVASDGGTAALLAPTGISGFAFEFLSKNSGNLISTGDTGTVSNTMLAHASVTVGGTTCTLGSTCSPAAGAFVPGTTVISGATAPCVIVNSTSTTSACVGPLGLSYGGTNASLTANAGGVVYSTSSALAIVNNPNSNGECLLSGTSAPTWGSCSGSTGVGSLGNYSADTSLTITGTGSGPWTGTVTAKLNLGNAQTWTAAQTFTNGDLLLKGSSSGAMTLEAPAAASSYVISFPAATDTVAVLGTAQTFTALQKYTNGDFALLGSSTGYTLLESGLGSSSNNTLTLPTTASDTLAALGTVQTWTAAQTFTNGDLLLKGSSSGAMTLEAPAVASTYVISFPAATDTVDVLGTAQTFTAVKTFTNSDLRLLGSSTGYTTFTSGNSGSSNYTITVPAITDTLTTATETQTFTNKTFNTAGSGNVFEINGTQITAISGNTGTTATTNGSLVNGDCVSIDSSGNLVDAGGPCTTGGGGGTVNSGVAGQVAYYNTTGTAVSGTANVTMSAGQVTIGQSGSVLGSIVFSGSTSGAITVKPQTTAGTAAILLPNTAGTFADGASSPLALNTTTGNLTITGLTGGVLAGSGPAFTTTPTLGASGTFGSLGFGNNTSGTVTLETVSGALGSVVASLPANTGTLAETNYAQTWSAAQTFNNGDLILSGSSSGSSILEAPSTGGGTVTLQQGSYTDAALNLTDQTVSGGANVTSYSISTGSFTVDCGKAPLQYQTGTTSAETITAPSNDGSCVIQYTNVGSGTPGAVTFSGFTVNSNYTGGSIDTTNSHKFMLSIARVNGSSIYQIIPQQ